LRIEHGRLLCGELLAGVNARGVGGGLRLAAVALVIRDWLLSVAGATTLSRSAAGPSLLPLLKLLTLLPYR